MGHGYLLFENLKERWEACLEDRRLKALHEDLEIVLSELTNGASPPYSEYTQGVLHDFDEVRDGRFEKAIYFD